MGKAVGDALKKQKKTEKHCKPFLHPGVLSAYQNWHTFGSAIRALIRIGTGSLASGALAP